MDRWVQKFKHPITIGSSSHSIKCNLPSGWMKQYIPSNVPPPVKDTCHQLFFSAPGSINAASHKIYMTLWFYFRFHLSHFVLPHLPMETTCIYESCCRIHLLPFFVLVWRNYAVLLHTHTDLGCYVWHPHLFAQTNQNLSIKYWFPDLNILCEWISWGPRRAKLRSVAFPAVFFRRNQRFQRNNKTREDCHRAGKPIKAGHTEQYFMVPYAHHDRDFGSDYPRDSPGQPGSRCLSFEMMHFSHYLKRRRP